MTDTIATRVTRVIGGSVHALLDVMENAAPEATMAQAIREVDQAIDEVRSELGRVEAVKHVASSSLNKLNTQKETLAEQIDIAMTKGDETLARAGIAQQIDIDDQIPVLQRSLQDSIGRGSELEGYIAALLAKKREMESALQDFIAARARAAPALRRAGATHRAAARRARSSAPARHSIGCSARETGLAVAGSARQSGCRQAARAAGHGAHAPDRRTPRRAEGRANEPAVTAVSGILRARALAVLARRRAADRRGGGRGAGAADRREPAALARRRRGDHPDGFPDGALGWLHFGRVPILVILVIFLMTFALAGFIAQFVARGVIGFFLPCRLAVVLALWRRCSACASSAARLAGSSRATKPPRWPMRAWSAGSAAS